MAYMATGTAGNDPLDQSANAGPGTIVGLAGDDTIRQGTGLATITGDSGNDIVILQTGNTGTVNGGTENDSITTNSTAIGAMALFGGDGADTVDTGGASSVTVVGGNDSADGADSILGGLGDEFMLGNGGADTLILGTGNNTAVGGFGNDAVNPVASFSPSTNLVFGNEGNDTVLVSDGSTVFGGTGNDCILESNRSGAPVLLFGNEGSDTLFAAAVSAGNQTFVGGNDFGRWRRFDRGRRGLGLHLRQRRRRYDRRRRGRQHGGGRLRRRHDPHRHRRRHDLRQ